MGLNDFAAYIQFFTAFYISLGFEELIDKIFFNDVYKERVKSLFSNIMNDIKLKDSQAEELSCLLETRIKNSRIVIRRISFVSFIFCLILLLIAGLELSIPNTVHVYYNFFKNSWLGYSWLYVILFVSMPFIGISFWALHRRFWKLYVLRKISKKGAEKLYNNVSCYLTGKYKECDNEFSSALLKGVNEQQLNPLQILEYAKGEYTNTIVKRLKEKI